MEPDSRPDWFARLLIAVFLGQCLLAAVRPMVSYRAIALGAGAFELGIVAASFSLLALAFAIPLGRWTDRLGTFPILVLGSSINLGSTAALLWVDSIAALIVAQACLGVGQLCVAVSSQTLVGNGRSRRSRDSRFGSLTLVISIAQFVAPLGAGAIAGSALGHVVALDNDEHGTSGVFLVASAFGVLSVLLVVSMASRSRTGTTPPAAKQSASSIPLRGVLSIKGMPQALIASALVFTCIDILTVYLPAYGEDVGLSVETVTWLLAARAAGSIVGRALMVPLLSAIGRRRLLIVSVVAPAFCLVVFPLIPVVALLFALVAVAGVGLGIGQPVTLAWSHQRTPLRVRGTAAGIRIAAMRIAQSILPPAIGATAVAAGVWIVFPVLSATLAVVALTVATAEFDDEEEPDPESNVDPGLS